jgi:hypothetical protein
MIVLSSAVCAILTFTLLFVHNVAGVVAFTTLYGFFSGACSSNHSIRASHVLLTMRLKDISLLPPTVAILSDEISEIGARLGICLGCTGMFL